MSRETQKIETALFWLGLVVVVGGLLFALQSVLMPFAAGFAIAYFLDPVADRLEEKGIGRGVAVLLILGAFLLLLILVLMLVAPLLADQVVGLIRRVPDILAGLQDALRPVMARLQTELAANGLGSFDGLSGSAGEYAKEAAAWVLGVLRGVWAGGMAVFHAVSLVLIMPLVAFYLLRDWDRIIAHLNGLLPRNGGDAVREQARRIDETLSAFLRGQATVCLVLAVIYGGGLTLVGLEFGLLIGVATGLMSFVPYFGMGVGLVTAFGVAAFQFADIMPFVLIGGVFAIGQVLESFFLTPYLVGDKVGLHPLWVVFALMAGGALFGFTGVLLAVPAASVIGVLIRFWIERYKSSGFFESA